ncbi:hypothetical protein CHLNCDRAFT_133443 [Chlorella variabilis]|uniref:CBS domain-containing protein n=1 Tax=Chlorella variabilis TaxID=554065 RepID=E1Z341_CHLVA|nr:hypothetical protein CHLNCDRAFT_133443 [Chlorella variabilis]EFN59772.1 hypothetical protein CHLNCDRAFT_133443 [Chlorella variabilis]|eukprot:XP_005851874.1 hypothetical protein CHLNCDRAFT_133443 [Chlorella variabilis]
MSDTEMDGRWAGAQRLLSNTKVSDVCKTGQKIVLLEHNQTIGDALKTLAKNGILSAPMVISPDIEEVQGGSMSPQLLGWIDVADVLRGFLQHLQEAGHELPTQMLKLMTLLEKEGPVFSDRLLVTIRGVEDRGLVYQAEGGTTSLLDAIRNLFLRPVVHRLAVFEAHGEITNIVSQTDVMRFLLSRVDELGPVANQSLEELGMLTGKPPVLSVNPHLPALLAYAQFAAQQVSGAPVVTDSGELIANLSISDIRAITAEQFGALALPVAEFLAVQHGTAYLGYSATTSEHARHPFFASANRSGGPAKGDIQLFTARRDTTLAQLLQKIVGEHIHRVYVVDSDEAPRVQAVITPTDILRLVAGVY